MKNKNKLLKSILLAGTTMAAVLSISGQVNATKNGGSGGKTPAIGQSSTKHKLSSSLGRVKRGGLGINRGKFGFRRSQITLGSSSSSKQTNEAQKAEEAQKIEEARLAEEAAKKAEETRLAEEAQRAEDARLAAEAKKAEEDQKAEEEAKQARLAEEAQKAEAKQSTPAQQQKGNLTQSMVITPKEKEGIKDVIKDVREKAKSTRDVREAAKLAQEVRSIKKAQQNRSAEESQAQIEKNQGLKEFLDNYAEGDDDYNQVLTLLGKNTDEWNDLKTQLITDKTSDKTTDTTSDKEELSDLLSQMLVSYLNLKAANDQKAADDKDKKDENTIDSYRYQVTRFFDYAFSNYYGDDYGQIKDIEQIETLLKQVAVSVNQNLHRTENVFSLILLLRENNICSYILDTLLQNYQTFAVKWMLANPDKTKTDITNYLTRAPYDYDFFNTLAWFLNVYDSENESEEGVAHALGTTIEELTNTAVNNLREQDN